MMMMMSSVAPVEEEAAVRRRGRRRRSRRRSESRMSGSEESGSVGVAENEENASVSFGSVSHKKQQLQSSLNAAGSVCEADNSMCGSDDDRSGTTTTTTVVVLREQDYIGLSSEVSSSSSPSPLPSSSSCFRTVLRSPSCSKESEKGVVREEELNLNLGATELRLGPRPQHQESGRCAKGGREPMTCSTDELEPFAASGLDKAQVSSQKPSAAAAASDRVVAAAAASADRARTTTGSFRSFPNSETWNGEELQREQQQGCDETLNLGISLVPNNRGCNRSEQVAAAADKKKLFHVSGGSAAMEEDDNDTKQSRSNQQQAAGSARSRFPYNGTEMVSQKPKQLGAQQYPSTKIIYPGKMKPLLPPLPTSSSSSWQQQQLQTREQPGGLFGTFHPQPQLAASRGPLPQLMSNRASDASAESNPKTWDSFSSSSLPPKKLEEASFTAVASSEFAKHPSPNKQPPATAVKEVAAPTTAPPRQAPVVVGWPPVRNFRRNALAFQQQPPRSAPPSPQERQPRPTTTTTNPLAPTSVGMMTPPTPPANGGATPSQTSILVKVYMDGLPIGRKVDLTTHNSYDKLKYALEDMFQQFIGQPIGGPQSFTGGNTGVSSSTSSRKLNFLHNSDYVLTYEDCDSDHMLVGDVPWEMFTTIVRRLRIMKGVDIAQRGGDNTMSSQVDVV
ncbi:hypothetical protein BDL97_03G089100 [Sphagnum fallax]|nr:hypothetical protein BDL97_03G089100 [Sphagnum fallax]